MKSSGYLLLFLSLSLLVVGQFLGKSGSKYLSISSPSVQMFLNPYIVGAFLLTFAYGLVWILVLKRMDLSFAYPLTSLSFVLIPLISHFFLGEQLTLVKIVGALFILFGVFCTTSANAIQHGVTEDD